MTMLSGTRDEADMIVAQYAVDRLYGLFRAAEIESLEGAFYRGHLRSALLWLEAQP